MTDPLYIKQNDLQPLYYAQVKDANGDVIDITGATIRVTLKDADDNSLKVNRGTTGITLEDEANGKFSYTWQAGDTDTAGKFYIEFEITPSAGGKFTVPADPDEIAVVYIEPDFDAT